MIELQPSIHPGEILLVEFLEPLGITAYRLAKAIGVPQTRISNILAGRVGITADTAVRFARYFGTTPQYWLNLQSLYELDEIKRGKGPEVERITPLERPTPHELVSAGR
jgi:addiction module HigA family antidote